MKAILYHRYGGADTLRLDEKEVGKPSADQVVVRVRAVALNPIDWKLRDGQLRWIHPLRFPVTPGFDFCGEILQTGENVRSFAVGDRVCGMSDQRAGGMLAEEACCSASVVAPVPDGMSDEEAAALPLAGLTALQGLRDHGKMKSGTRLLVNGASGGVGHLAVQVAAAREAQVTAVCGSSNVEWVSRLGPEKTVDYKKSDWLKETGKFSVIFDAVGNLGFGKSKRHLEGGGSYVTTLPGPRIFLDQWLRSRFTRFSASTFLARPSHDDLTELLRMWSAGQLRIRIDEAYDWAHFRAAFTHLESGHARGKIILRIP